jgi:hypothetical protein
MKGGPEERSRYSDSLRAGRSRDRIPAGARFLAPVQTDPGAHPAPFTMGTVFLSRGLGGRGVALTTHPWSSAEVKERVQPHVYSPSGPSRSLPGRTLLFYLRWRYKDLQKERHIRKYGLEWFDQGCDGWDAPHTSRTNFVCKTGNHSFYKIGNFLTSRVNYRPFKENPRWSSPPTALPGRYGNSGWWLS